MRSLVRREKTETFFEGTMFTEKISTEIVEVFDKDPEEEFSKFFSEVINLGGNLLIDIPNDATVFNLSHENGPKCTIALYKTKYIKLLYDAETGDILKKYFYINDETKLVEMLNSLKNDIAWLIKKGYTPSTEEAGIKMKYFRINDTLSYTIYMLKGI